jgi:hypothetical protein
VTEQPTQNALAARFAPEFLPTKTNGEARSPDERQRNPGPPFKLASRSRISRSLSSGPGRFGPDPLVPSGPRKKGRRNAGRRVSPTSAPATFIHPASGGGQRRGRGARPAGRARLSAFHRGSCLGDPTPPLSSGYALPGTQASTGVARLAPVPVQRAPRRPVIVPAGRIPEAARGLISQANVVNLTLNFNHMINSFGWLLGIGKYIGNMSRRAS